MSRCQLFWETSDHHPKCYCRDPEYSGSDDERKLKLLAQLSKRGSRLVEDSRAGAELILRSHWGAVEHVTDYLRTIGELTPPHGVELIRMPLEGPQKPLTPDIDTLIRQVRELEDVPEFKEQFESAARTLSARVA